MADTNKTITIKADDPHISAALPAVATLFVSMAILGAVLKVAWLTV